MIRTLKLRPKFQWTDNINAGKNNTDGKTDKITTEAEEQEELRDVITSDALEDLEVIQGKGEWKNKMTNRKNANTSASARLNNCFSIRTSMSTMMTSMNLIRT